MAAEVSWKGWLTQKKLPVLSAGHTGLGLFSFLNYLHILQVLHVLQDAAVHKSVAAFTEFNGVNGKVRTEWKWRSHRISEETDQA